MAECPHCKKPLRIVKAGEFPVEQDREQADHMTQTYLPIKDLDDALEEYQELLEYAEASAHAKYMREYIRRKPT